MKTKESIILLSLQQALAYWERVNRIGDMLFHMCQKVWPYHLYLDTADTRKKYKALAGSELTEVYRLGRPIPNYKLLREALERGENFDPIAFLPRIPKNMRNKFSSQTEYLEANYALSPKVPPYLLPVFINRWLSTKKVCEVTNPKQIPLVDTCEKCYLSYLPYDSFVLRLGDPLHRVLITGAKQEDNHYCKYADFLIHREGDILKILGIPSDVQFLGFTDEQTQALNNVMSLSKNSSKQKIDNTLNAYSMKSSNLITLLEDFSLERININSGMIVVHDPNYVIQEFDPLAAIEKHLYKAKHKSTDEVLKQIASEWSLGAFLFLLNGLAKLFYEYEAPQGIKLHDLSASNNNLSDSNDIPAELKTPMAQEIVSTEREAQRWYEVSPGNITYVALPKRRFKGVGVRINTGREMPPHLRRGHYRHFRDDDGVIVKKVFIKQATIRKDRLKNGETIHGSLSEYK